MILPDPGLIRQDAVLQWDRGWVKKDRLGVGDWMDDDALGDLIGEESGYFGC